MDDKQEILDEMFKEDENARKMPLFVLIIIILGVIVLCIFSAKTWMNVIKTSANMRMSVMAASKFIDEAMEGYWVLIDNISNPLITDSDYAEYLYAKKDGIWYVADDNNDWEEIENKKKLSEDMSKCEEHYYYSYTEYSKLIKDYQNFKKCRPLVNDEHKSIKDRW